MALTFKKEIIVDNHVEIIVIGNKVTVIISENLFEIMKLELIITHVIFIWM